MSGTGSAQQLQMIMSNAEVVVPELPAGYVLRTFRPSDTESYIELMHAAGFGFWNADVLGEWLNRVLPDGLFVVEHDSGAIVATAMATHNPSPQHPFGGELGWVAGRPEHKGKGLGAAVCAAVVRRYREAGYKRIYLKTDDHRLPAIKVYLKLGFLPFLFAPDTPERWQAVCEKLNWPFTPELWPAGRVPVRVPSESDEQPDVDSSDEHKPPRRSDR